MSKTKNATTLLSLVSLLALAVCASGCDSQAATHTQADAAAASTTAASAAAEVEVEPSFDVAPAKPLGASPETHTG